MSKVVFVGNVPYNMGEEQLVEVFKSVGQVVGFRLVFDRDTGKAKGYGFCEFADHETALSAVRNLNNTDVGGRPLRIDLADSDPFLEGKSTVRGEIRNSASSLRGEDSLASLSSTSMSNLPPGKPAPPGMTTLDAISQTLATMPTGQGLEMLAQMKAFIISHPDQAKILLQKQPQLSYALFQALVLHNIVPAEVIMRMHGGSTGAGPVPPAAAPPISQAPSVARPPPPPHLQHPPPFGMPPFPPAQTMSPVGGMPPPPGMGPPPSSGGYPGMPPYYRAPGPPPSASPVPPPVAPSVAAPPAAAPAIDDSQRDMIMMVLSMSQEAINSLPEAQRQGIMQLRSQFMSMAPQS